MCRVDCDACGKITVTVPWARLGSGFTPLFEALALSLRQSMPVAQAAALLLVRPERLWRRIDHYVEVAYAQEEMKGVAVAVVGIDETSSRGGHEYVTLGHNLEVKRLLFITEGRKHDTAAQFKADLVAHDGDPDDIKYVCLEPQIFCYLARPFLR